MDDRERVVAVAAGEMRVATVRSTVAILLVSLSAAAAAAQGRLSGTWKGHWTRVGDIMAVTLHVRHDSGNVYSATFDSDRLRVSGIPFTDVRLQGCCDVTLVLRGDRTTATFQGTLPAADYVPSLLRWLAAR